MKTNYYYSRGAFSPRGKYSRRPLLAGLTAVIAFATLSSQDARASDLYWWPGGVDGGTGTWNATSNWNTAADGSGTQQVWSGTDTVAILAGTPGTVSLSADTLIGGLTITGGYSIQIFDTTTKTFAVGGDITINGAAGSATTFSAKTRLGLNNGVRTINVADGNTLSLLGRITSANTGPANAGGAGGIIKTGGGILSLNDVSNFNGGITLQAGTLQVSTSNGSAFLNSSDTYSTLDNKLTLSGGTLENTSASNANLTAKVSVDFNGIVTFAGATGTLLTFDGSAGVAGAASLRLTNNSTLTVNDGLTVRITDTLGEDQAGRNLVKAGAGTLTFTKDNTYTGATVVNEGKLQIGNGTGGSISSSSALSATTGAIIGFNQANGSVISNAIDTGGGSVYGGEGSGITNTFSGIISGEGSFTQTGAGTSILTGSNTYTGATNVNAGQLNVDGYLSSSSAVNVASGATLGGSGTAGGVVAVTGGTINGTGLTVGATTFNGNSNLAGTVAASSITVAEAGALNVTGTTSSDVTVNNATLNGTGSTGGVVLVSGTLNGTLSTGAISGTGLVSPGNSPGILTAPSITVGSGLNFAFELTAAAALYSDATASGNDVLHLTGATPFSSNLTAENTISVYLASASAGSYLGGFFVDSLTSDLLASVKDATFAYYVQDTDGTYDGDISFNGNYYTALDSSVSVTFSAVSVTGADFATGTVNGSELEFTVVPEPSTWALLVASGIGFLLIARKQRVVAA